LIRIYTKEKRMSIKVTRLSSHSIILSVTYKYTNQSSQFNLINLTHQLSHLSLNVYSSFLAAVTTSLSLTQTRKKRKQKKETEHKEHVYSSNQAQHYYYKLIVGASVLMK